jgi:hypothetical protein
MRCLFFVTIALSLLVCGCSSNSSDSFQNPVTPAFSKSESMPVGVCDRFSDGSPAAGFGVMGIYNLELNSEQMSAELTSLRTGALTDTLEVVDITNFLSMAPCSDCAKIKSVSLDADGNLVVSIGLKHPFDAGDPLKPISGRNRGDLHVFNIEGIIAAQDASTVIFPAMGNSIASAKLINASGYSPYLDDVLDTEVFETDADIHPYILHFDDYSAGNFLPENAMGFESVTDPPPSGNLVMAMGCDYDYKDYVFDLSAGDISYTYAIGCTYAVSSASKSQRFSPEYRVPQHLKKAASEINVIPPVELLKESDPAYEVSFQVEVVDRSHGVVVDNARDEMKADSSVGEVVIEIPGVLATTVSQVGSAAISGTGHDPTDPLVFEFTISNEESAVAGIYPGLVKVLDSYPTGLNESPLLSGMDGIKRVDPLANPLTGMFDITEFATYATFEMGIELGYIGEFPVAHLVSTAPPACINRDVTFDASGSTDLEDDAALIPLNFEWDLDYDGVTFDADIPMSTDPIAVTQYTDRDWYEVAVRVTDSDLNTDIASVAFAVSGLLPGDSEIDITDGSSITDIQYMHGLFSQGVGPTDIGQRPKATRGLARCDGFVYVTFYGEESGSGQIYFARSDDDGATWTVPVSLHTYDSTGEYGGCSIGADDTGLVCVVWTDYFHRDLVLEYSTDNGDTFSTNVIHDLEDPSLSDNYWYYMFHQPDVAIDPNSPDNVVVTVQPRIMNNYGTAWSPPQIIAAYLSTSGVSGTFVETFYGDPRPDDHDNIYNMQAHFLSDGDAYMIIGSNGRTIVMRSSDGGATWPYDDEHIDWSWEPDDPPYLGWHRETSSAFDPNDTETFYVVQVRRSHWYNHPIHVGRATDGLHLEELHWEINDNTSHSVNRFNPNVTVDNAGVVYVMWQSEKNGSFDIIADYSCDGGITFGTDVQFNTVDNNHEIDPFVIANEAGLGIICVWEQDGFNSCGKLVVRQG